MPLLNTKVNPKGLTGKFVSDLVFQILSYVAEQERINIKARQREGIDIALREKRPYGRPSITVTEEYKKVHAEWKSGEITAKNAMDRLNMKRTSFYKLSNQLQEQYKIAS